MCNRLLLFPRRPSFISSNTSGPATRQLYGHIHIQYMFLIPSTSMWSILSIHWWWNIFHCKLRRLYLKVNVRFVFYSSISVPPQCRKDYIFHCKSSPMFYIIYLGMYISFCFYHKKSSLPRRPLFMALTSVMALTCVILYWLTGWVLDARSQGCPKGQKAAVGTR